MKLKKNEYRNNTDKKQIDLKQYGEPYLPNTKIYLFLPCSGTKPYKNSKTHKFINQKLRETFNDKCLDMIQVNTVSEVRGIIPQHLEDEIFANPEHDYNRAPDSQDVKHTAQWLFDFIVHAPNEGNDRLFIFYATSRIFREICTRTQELLAMCDKIGKNGYVIEDNYVAPIIELRPCCIKNPKSALFEFQKRENINYLLNDILQHFDFLTILRYASGKRRKEGMKYMKEDENEVYERR